MELLRLSTGVIFHPIETFRLIKLFRNDIKFLPVSIILLFIIVVRVIYIYLVHYPLASLLPTDSNIWLESVKFYVPILTWVVACFAVTSVIGGEALAMEIFTASAYSMMPYIVFTLPVTLFSRVLGRSEAGLFNILMMLIWIWVFFLYFISVKTINDYTAGKTVFICFLSIFTMLLIWAALLLVFALTSQLIYFFKDIMLEMKMKYLE